MTEVCTVHQSTQIVFALMNTKLLEPEFSPKRFSNFSP